MLKIAFLFLTIGPVYHQHLWRTFLQGHEEHYTIYAHAKNDIPADNILFSYQIPTKLPTTWSNTMRAQIALLKEALKDPDNTKFIFISETTIPLATFDIVYQRVLQTPHSIFMYRPNPHIIEGSATFDPSRNLQPIPAELQYKCYQWVVLNREHAQLMVEDTYYIAIAEQHRLDNEHYPATLLACHNLLHEVEQKSMTYVYWPAKAITRAAHPYSFVNFEDPAELALATKAINNGYLFMRKIDKACVMEPLERLLPYLTP
jgi:Core-2/I-Branching enzyme